MTVHKVAPGGDLQGAINRAVPGDEIELQAGGTYLAPADFSAYNLPNKGTSTSWITIRSSAPTPADGTRVTMANRASMPKLVARVGSPGFFNVANRAHHWRFSNLWFTNQRRADGSGTTYLIGGGADDINHDVNNFPHDCVIDHCFFNPLEWDEDNNNLYSSVNYAVELAGSNITVRDSYMTGFGCRYQNSKSLPLNQQEILDSGGVLIGVSPGPYTIDNCHIEAWFVGFFLGGGDPGSANRATVQESTTTSLLLSQTANLAAGDYISFRTPTDHPDNPHQDAWGASIVESVSGNRVTLRMPTQVTSMSDNKRNGPPALVGGTALWRGWIPSDIRVTRTDFYKPKRWFDLNGSDGKGFFEIKLGDRVLIDGCKFNGRTGCTITVRNQGGAAAWSVIRNLTMSNCLFEQFSVLFATLFDDNQRLSMPSENIRFENILAYGDVGPDANFGIKPKIFTGQHGDNIVFDHITALQSGEIIRSGSGQPALAAREQMTRFRWTNCITNWGTGEQYGFVCLNSTTGANEPCVPGYQWAKSVMIGAPKGPLSDRRSMANFPPGNFNPATIAEVGFVDVGKNDYTLRSDSPYRNAGTDNKDIGVDMVQLRAHLSGSVTAPPLPPTPPTPPTPPIPDPPVPPDPPTPPTPPVPPVPPPAPTGKNVALASNGGVATASSMFKHEGFSYLPSSVNDGDRKGANPGKNSNWASADNTLPQWVEIAFPKPVKINRVDVFSMQDDYHKPVEPTEGMTFTKFGLTSFFVDYWNSSAWISLAEVTGNNKIWRTFTFSPVTTTKLRLMVTGSADNWSRVVELEAWGEEAVAEPPPPPPPPPPDPEPPVPELQGVYGKVLAVDLTTRLQQINEEEKTGAVLITVDDNICYFRRRT